MLFNSYEFIFAFLPIVFVGYFYLMHKKLIIGGKVWLTVASLVFYSWWNVYYLPLILISIFVNFFIGSSLSLMNRNESDKIKVKKINIAKSVTKKQLLIFGLMFNIGLLLFFKYIDMLIVGSNYLFHINMDILDIVLPIGISFFTITQIAYLVDSYEGLVEEYDLLNYMIFVSFFPHLLIGPILHHKDMMPQFASKWNFFKNYKNISKGLFIFSIGLFKKVVIASQFEIWATNGFDKAEVLTFFESWVTSLSYTFQLYFDFSGYTDMAIGVALLFNIKLPSNFNSPYRSKSVIEFWQRWHITMTKFITTYIYSPIVRSFEKITFIKSMFAMFIAMFIAGIWHGGTLHYIIFYTVHALALIINHYWRKLKIKINKFIAWFITFNFINISFIIFRANEWSDVVKVVKGMFGMSGVVLPNFLHSYFNFFNSYNVNFGGVFYNISGDYSIPFWFIGVFMMTFLFTNSIEKLYKFNAEYKTLLIAIICFTFSVLSLHNVSQFIYFNF